MLDAHRCPSRARWYRHGPRPLGIVRRHGFTLAPAAGRLLAERGAATSLRPAPRNEMKRIEDNQ